MTECSFLSYYPAGQNCSARGTCVTSQDDNSSVVFCQCDQGWLSTADLAFERVDCDQHVATLVFLHWFSLAIHVSALLYLLYCFCILSKFVKRETGLKRLIYLISSMVSVCFGATVSIIKISSGAARMIGEDAFITLSFLAMVISFWFALYIGISLYLIILETSVDRFSKGETVKTTMNDASKRLKLIYITTFVHVLPFFNIFYKEHHILIARLWILSSGVSLLLLLLFWVNVLQSLRKAHYTSLEFLPKDSTDYSKINTLMKEFEFLIRFFRSLYIIFVISVVNFFWQYTLRFNPYMYIGIFNNVPILLCMIGRIFCKNARQKMQKRWTQLKSRSVAGFNISGFRNSEVKVTPSGID